MQRETKRYTMSPAAEEEDGNLTTALVYHGLFEQRT